MIGQRQVGVHREAGDPWPDQGHVVGEAHSTQATVGANISVRGATMPATLGGFQNTPMEQAIRECIEKATAYAVANTPQDYFHHASR